MKNKQQLKLERSVLKVALVIQILLTAFSFVIAVKHASSPTVLLAALLPLTVYSGYMVGQGFKLLKINRGLLDDTPC